MLLPRGNAPTCQALNPIERKHQACILPHLTSSTVGPAGMQLLWATPMQVSHFSATLLRVKSFVCHIEHWCNHYIGWLLVPSSLGKVTQSLSMCLVLFFLIPLPLPFSILVWEKMFLWESLFHEAYILFSYKGCIVLSGSVKVHCVESLFSVF